jgi:hypothetical protein
MSTWVVAPLSTISIEPDHCCQVTLKSVKLVAQEALWQGPVGQWYRTFLIGH